MSTHDLRDVLAGILVIADQLSDADLDDAGQEHVAEILGEALSIVIAYVADKEDRDAEQLLAEIEAKADQIHETAEAMLEAKSEKKLH